MNIEAIFTAANTSYEHCTSMAEVMRSNPVQTRNFFQVLLVLSTAKVVFITPNSLLKTTVHRYDFIYLQLLNHHFTGLLGNNIMTTSQALFSLLLK